MALPAWCAPFIGLRFRERGRDRRGVDCWGLAILAGRALGIEFPDYAYNQPLDDAEIGPIIRTARAAPPWREVAFEDRQAGDIVSIKVLGMPAHVGIVADREFFLHIGGPSSTSVAVRIAAVNWRNRIDGVFRYEP